jgi:serine/threonine protein kinase
VDDDTLGTGGQGEVYCVRKKSGLEKDSLPKILEESIPYLSGAASVGAETKLMHSERLAQALADAVFIDDKASWGALKVLKALGARDAERAKERMQREIDAIERLSHPNLVKILDYDRAYNWYVMKFYQRGTLTDNRKLYINNFERTFHDFFLLLNGVASIHDEELIHRDIKPDNIFVDDDGTLVLSDFGLVYDFGDDGDDDRLSGTFENVGTRTYMAPWAAEHRIEDPLPNFDVFSLGKVLWWMLSGRGHLPHWWHHRDPFNLEKIFPENPLMKLVNQVLARCVVEDEEDCLLNASQLMREIDRCLSFVCKNCRKGIYEELPSYAQTMSAEGLILEMCSNCSNTRIDGGKLATRISSDKRFTTMRNPRTAQGAEWRYVDTKDRVLESIRFKVEPRGDYWRAGFIIGEPSPNREDPFGAYDNRLVFHVGQDNGDGIYRVDAYEGINHSVDNDGMPLVDDGSISISFTYDGSDSVTCDVNGKSYPFKIDSAWLKRVVLRAWGDEADYAVTFTDIETNPSFGLLDKLAIP